MPLLHIFPLGMNINFHFLSISKLKVPFRFHQLIHFLFFCRSSATASYEFIIIIMFLQSFVMSCSACTMYHGCIVYQGCIIKTCMMAISCILCTMAVSCRAAVQCYNSCIMYNGCIVLNECIMYSGYVVYNGCIMYNRCILHSNGFAAITFMPPITCFTPRCRSTRRFASACQHQQLG